MGEQIINFVKERWLEIVIVLTVIICSGGMIKLCSNAIESNEIRYKKCNEACGDDVVIAAYNYSCDCGSRSGGVYYVKTGERTTLDR